MPTAKQRKEFKDIADGVLPPNAAQQQKKGKQQKEFDRMALKTWKRRAWR